MALYSTDTYRRGRGILETIKCFEIRGYLYLSIIYSEVILPEAGGIEVYSILFGYLEQSYNAVR